ncbi:hypothetical protein AVEN_31149-1 [Araneus ventricosus]|uniref:Uncharacterized protein n=1 Tax=Araneus ventricosus TaxID=182803 RepID=A0A4Y1ZZM6_ARAVE|nr:hypothetical protein AVEN_31149-1 [Araneus ventricosus]
MARVQLHTTCHDRVQACSKLTKAWKKLYCSKLQQLLQNYIAKTEYVQPEQIESRTADPAETLNHWSQLNSDCGEDFANTSLDLIQRMIYFAWIYYLFELRMIRSNRERFSLINTFYK